MFKGTDYKTLMFYLENKKGFELNMLNFKRSVSCELHYNYPFGRVLKLSFLTLDDIVHTKDFKIKDIKQTYPVARRSTFFTEPPVEKAYVTTRQARNLMLTIDSITTIDPKLLRR